MSVCGSRVEYVMSATAFLHLLTSDRSEAFVTNLSSTLEAARLGDATIPCSVSSGAPTCYVCCPSTAYVDYARFEILTHDLSRTARMMARPLLLMGALLVRSAGLDRQVQVNNWLVATNPPVKAAGWTLERCDLAHLVDHLIVRYPHHVIFWRSLNARSDDAVMGMMRMAGWVLVPSRRVYLLDCRKIPPRTGRDEARDRAILASSCYEVVDGSTFSDDDFERAAQLYAMLYLCKYTSLNPQYTARFIAALTRAGILDLRGLRVPNGRLDGIIGFLDGGDVMTAPVVGYDTGIPQRDGLYRMLMAIAFGRARMRGLLFNASAGADGFKLNRGAEPVLEWSAVYDRHRPWPQRVALRLLALLLTRVAVPILEKVVA